MPEIMSDRETASGAEKSADKKREIYRMNASANSVTMSIYLWKQAYSAALSSTDELRSFYLAFSVNL